MMHSFASFPRLVMRLKERTFTLFTPFCLAGSRSNTEKEFWKIFFALPSDTQWARFHIWDWKPQTMAMKQKAFRDIEKGEMNNLVTFNYVSSGEEQVWEKRCENFLRDKKNSSRDTERSFNSRQATNLRSAPWVKWNSCPMIHGISDFREFPTPHFTSRLEIHF